MYYQRNKAKSLQKHLSVKEKMDMLFLNDLYEFDETRPAKNLELTLNSKFIPNDQIYAPLLRLSQLPSIDSHVMPSIKSRKYIFIDEPQSIVSYNILQRFNNNRNRADLDITLERDQYIARYIHNFNEYTVYGKNSIGP